MTFEAWVQSIFDRPAIDGGWYWQIEQEPAFHELTARHPALAVQYLKQLFDSAGALLQPYSDGQIEWGLWYIASPGASDVAHELNNQAVPLDLRLSCIEAMYGLYEQVFAVRCQPLLAHLERGERGTPVNTICYMWWDVLPLYVPPESPEYRRVHGTVLRLFERVLALDLMACWESALHGLNHWHFELGDTRREQIIQAFLTRNPHLQTELKRYAEICSGGCAL